MSLRDQLLAGALVPVTAVATSLYNRRHKNDIEEQVGDVAAMSAVNDANIALTQLVVSTMAPLQAQIDRQEVTMGLLQNELDKHRRALVKHETQQRLMREWITRLVEQLRDAGIEPHPAPLGLPPETGIE